VLGVPGSRLNTSLRPVPWYGIKGEIVNSTKLTIGRVAAAAKVSVETVRYYQRCGLLEEPLKPMGGYRHYSPEIVKRLRFIKRAQALGFALKEIAGLLQLDDRLGCATARQVAAQKLAAVEEKLAGLATIRNGLIDLVQQCDAVGGGGTCPIIEGLEERTRTLRVHRK
jgi:MerR family transcriptional regulator, mercuric resistance operon regulatory protein